MLTALYAFSLLVALSIGLTVGFLLSWLKTRIMELTQATVVLMKRTPVPEVTKSPQASIIDPDDLQAQAQRDFDEMHDRLNPR